MTQGFPSKKHPAYVNLVDETGAQIGTDANPLKTSASTGGGTQDVKITNTNTDPVPIINTPLSMFGGATKTVTTTADFVSIANCAYLTLSADPDNTDVIMYGSQTAQVFYLAAGQTVNYGDATVYFKAKSGTQTMGIGGFTNI